MAFCYCLRQFVCLSHKRHRYRSSIIERSEDDYADQAIEPDLNIETIFEERTPKRNAYLLITLYRSGSTLTGEMFNRNLDFLYFFEPLGKVKPFR